METNTRFNNTFYNKLILPCLISFMAMAFILMPEGLKAGNSTPVKTNTTTINSLPHFEDFSGVTIPNFPSGWSTFIQSSVSSLVETTSSQNPFSPPFHARFRPIGDANAQLILITPQITTPINQIRVRFHAMASTAAGNAIQVGTWNPETGGGFTPLYTLQLTGTYTQYLVEMDDYTGTDTHLAFRAVPGGSYNTIFLDDLLLDEIPTGPVLSVLPYTWDFGQFQVNLTSLKKQFVISNQGTGILTINPEDIQLTGVNADQFVLENITQTINLAEFESDTISIAFAPETIGSKQAILQAQTTQATLFGEGIDATITDMPYLQDFDGVTIPELPFGWSKYVYHPTSGNARVETSTTGTPISAPQHVRLYSNKEPGAKVMLISPPVSDLKSKKVSFWTRMHLVTGLPDLVVGTMTDPTDTTTFTPFHILEGNVDISNVYTQFEIFFNPSIGEDKYIAFTYGGEWATWMFTYIDNFLIDDIPDEPLIFVSPDTYNFGQSQIGLTSLPKDFTIMNHGGGTLVLTSADISITGEHASQFSFEPFDGTIELTSGQTTDLKVFFTPETLGTKNATLQIQDYNVQLSGDGYDFTITTFPWVEDFSGLTTGGIPAGWVKDGLNWGAVTTSHAGGTSPEMRFSWSPEFVGEQMLKTPPINTSEYTTMLFSFRSVVNNFLTPGIYTLKVVAIDGDNQYLIKQWVDPDHIAAEQYLFTLNANDHGIGSENLQFAFIFDGTSEDINRWLIDDITLEEAHTVTFEIKENSPEPTPLQGATIEIPGENPIVTGPDGTASIDLGTGSFTATVSMPGYITQQNVFTVSQSMTISLALNDDMVAPFGLQVKGQGMEPSEALFTWMVDYDEFRYDDGVVAGQLGFQTGNINSIMGAVHHADAALHQMTWLLTDNGGPHTTVKVWVLGLDENGFPDRDNIIYSASDVPNTDLQWNTHVFPQPLNASEGFFIGVSTQGFLALGTDGGTNSAWPFNPLTQFAIQDITVPESEFTPIESWDFQRNFFIRGYGQEFDKHLVEKHLPEIGKTQGPVFIPMGMPLNTNTETYGESGQKVFTGFNVFLNDMENPIAENIQNLEYVLTNLQDGEHTAGVQAVYTTGITEIATIDFTYPIPVPVYTATFVITAENGTPIPDAQITINGTTYEPGEYAITELESGSYSFSISREGYLPYTGTAVIEKTDITINVEMQVQLYEVTFNVDMINASGFDPDNHQVFISGSFGGDIEWAVPGTNPELELSRIGSSMVFSVVLELEEADYQYKYFSDAYGAGWDGEEWAGEPNRSLSVEDNMVINDQWATYQGVSVGIISQPSANIYPNPAANNLKVAADALIEEIRIFDVRGQIVLHTTASDYSTELNVSALSNGMYFIQIRTRSGSVTRQLTISK